ncbi:hypothetical protein [Anaerophilus nitritogenes]|uniref:hypothetical protein n=1 Tax=Anaerophilus nitritogenes TaxID=2498136 RepID=UPI00101D5607|nr:hypothetical protein [Anaerophilus nitritogenes]
MKNRKKIRVIIILIISLAAIISYYLKHITLGFILINLSPMFIFVSSLIEEYKKGKKLSFNVILCTVFLTGQCYLVYRYLF